MRKYILISLLIVLSSSLIFSQSQAKKIDKSKPVHPTTVKTAIHFSISEPLRDLPPTKGPRTKEEQKAFKKAKEKKEGHLNFDMKFRKYPYAATAGPFGNDPVWQKQEGKTQAHQNRAPLLNFAGQDCAYSVSDCNGAAGPNHYMQGVNATYAIWDKNGTQVVSPTDFNVALNKFDFPTKLPTNVVAGNS